MLLKVAKRLREFVKQSSEILKLEKFDGADMFFADLLQTEHYPSGLKPKKFSPSWNQDVYFFDLNMYDYETDYDNKIKNNIENIPVQEEGIWGFLIKKSSIKVLEDILNVNFRIVEGKKFTDW